MAGSDRLSQPSTSGPGVPAFLGRPGPTPFHRLNPLTKATLAAGFRHALGRLGLAVGPAPGR